ncbi:MAG: UTP--glucose-1-phosphate uridylyltransferase [Clostridia bacterium]|nr:UTP--glucose-1-phosphate uridylyltransferase [Clostridia bacterium]
MKNKIIDVKLQKAQTILKKYGQEQLLQFYDELDIYQKELLLDQIVKTNFERLNKIYTKSLTNKIINHKNISPINYFCFEDFSQEKKNEYKLIGDKIIKNNELAVITLAGGQGTRLGYKGPKGCYEIDVPPKKSLFEFLSDKLKKVHIEYGVYLNWYIMTSIFNDEDTKEYFKQKNYFGYDKDKIYFFKQDTLPLVDKEGKIILDNLYTLKEGSNGNGDVFKAFYKSGLLKTTSKINWFTISGIDNILLEIIDPILLGLMVSNKSNVAAKSIAKENINDKDWVFAKVNNKVNIINPKHLTADMLNSKNERGKYNYNQINILSHIFDKKTFIKAIDLKLPYHRAFKKNDYINKEGVKTVPSEPNTFKFEKFIFDAFKISKNFTLLEVKKEDEFAPIKAFSGNETPEIALAMYLNKKNAHR